MKQPNLILITTDQQRFDAAGGTGPSWLRTPHFDDLRRQGITFSRAYADCPICVPSRATIMSGLSAQAHGMAKNGSMAEALTGATLPQLLGDAGYQTAAIGKMHFEPQRARYGFDEMILPADYYREMQRHGDDVQPMRHGLGQNELHPTLATVPESKTLTSWIAEQCVEYIRERRDPTRPFFLWCSFSKPHPPFDPPEPYYSMYGRSDIAVPVTSEWSQSDAVPPAFARARQMANSDTLDPEVTRAMKAAYYGLVTQCDYNMGRIFAALGDVGLWDDTMLLYTSDHGDFLGDHGASGKAFWHEGSAHVPFVLRPPKSWGQEARRAGTVCDSLACLTDVLPTLVAAGGGEVPESVEGVDLLAVARGESVPREWLEGFSTANGTGGAPSFFAITDGRWKYIFYPEGACEQLFDLQTDPLETRDLARETEHQATREHLSNSMLANQRARDSLWLCDGEFPTTRIGPGSEADHRSNGFAGYHTDYLEMDVRH